MRTRPHSLGSGLSALCLMMSIATCLGQHLLHEDDDYRRSIKFVGHQGKRLLVPISAKDATNETVVQKSLLTDDVMDCSFECLSEDWCHSLNFRLTLTKSGRHVCELISTDRYNHSEHLVQDKDFVHLGIKNRDTSNDGDLPNTSTDQDEWPNWRRRSERFRVATGFPKKNEPSQINTLIYSMGDRADDILCIFTIQRIIEEFEAHLVKKRNVIFERSKFNQSSQQPCESMETYIQLNCAYGDLREEMIRYRIVVGLQDGKLPKNFNWAHN
ncbi:predicted protein [Nematostella vectensis]|uniref:Apple domain-containing protein n=1 Tax=Nematostella vectensis TaxID=45351 RepID=A7SMN1_NEMVE|nr:predicted protein [Nematostella vectensis]|eukprot:XP_001627100.1 predicted protein [Nematostella vectensis]